MTRNRVRLGLFASCGLVFAIVVFWGLAGLHDFGNYEGEYGKTLNELVVPARHVTNVVAGTVFDVRAFDTMGEEFILFGALMGTALLLRESRDEQDDRPDDQARDDTIRLLALIGLPIVVLLGLWIVAFGYTTPGGGFQGGVVLGGALVLVWGAGSYRSYRAASPTWLVDATESIGAGGYVVVGIAALLSGASFLGPLLGIGKTGTLHAGGSIPLLNWAAGIEVASAVVLLFHEFLEEYVPTLARRRP